MEGERTVETETRRYYVNVVSLAPYSLGRGGPIRALEMVVEAGLAGVQLLPMRGYDYVSVKNLPRSAIVSYEGPWNSGTLFNALRREWRKRIGKSKPTDVQWPLLIDWLFFGPRPERVSTFKTLFPKALYVTHDASASGVYEIHPEGGFPLEEQPLCWDTFHTRRPYQASGHRSPFRWARLLEAKSKQVSLIHVHPVGSEISSLLAGQTEGELQDMLQMLARHTKVSVPIVIEVKPVLGTPAQAVRYISGLREGIVKVMETANLL